VLPNEATLCDRFSVSRATLREAARGLVEEGYLVRRQGSGTFVTERPLLRNSLDVNFSYTAYLESMGVPASRRVLSVLRHEAGEFVAERLRISPTATVVQVERVRTADGRPAIYSIDVLVADVVAGVDDAVFGESLYSFLDSLGRPIDHGEAVIEAAVADAHLAAVLDIVTGTPLLHLEQVDTDVTGRRILLAREWFVPDVIELRCFRRGPGISAMRPAADR
jgi:DNA-binding GntR family transcriptional regulator